MPQKKKPDTPKQQSQRFKRAVQELIDAGELSPTDAEERMEKLFCPPKIRRRPDGE